MSGTLAESFDENFNERSLQRTLLLHDFQVILDHHGVPVSFWAFCQFADIDHLEVLIRQFATAPLLVPLAIESCFAIPRIWAQKSPKFADGASTTVSFLSSHCSQRLAALTRERDGNRCVLTKSGLCDVAHIFAHYLLKPKKQPTASDRCGPSIWSVLLMFWSKNQVEEWRQAIFGDSLTGEDAVFNLVCLRSNLQQLILELQWLPRYPHTYEATIPITEYPLSTRNQDSVGDVSIICESSGELAKLASGSIIKLHTIDPVRLPLPSYALMEMAWHLSRVVSLSASGLLQELDTRFEGDEDDHRGPMAVPDRLLDWILSTNTSSASVSNDTDMKSTLVLAETTPMKR
ncbi:hypothetical protein BDV26DRAFT_291386 [Aspergillus bertholletiae]|uniref:HNH nuclease domain-containing protein n=1 Tax=Aspergillus bertholletiae TaxID=1226010 RepID=A0A5N7BC70_9EURO|nr:hypothetical protein BDV26DRAFT_291386 [Aspergillus bertholletiae]